MESFIVIILTYYLSFNNYIQMKQSKIIEILKVTPWESKYGTMYSYTLKLENNETIVLNKKKENAFKLWDSILYEEIEEGKKRREIKERKNDNTVQSQRWYFTSIAFQIAFDKAYKWDNDYQNTVYLAKRIFTDMMDNFEGK